MLRGPGRFLLAPAHLQGVCWAWGPVGSASVPPDLDSRLLEASTPDFCPEQDVGKRTRGPRGGLTLSLQPTVNQPPSPGVPVWGAPRSSSLWSPTPVPLLRFCHALGSPVSQEPRTPAFLGARSGAARELSAESATIPCPALGPPLLTPCSGVSGRGQAWATGPVLSPSPSPGRPAILRNGHLSSLENLPDVGRKELA